jgi:hypothetical protein
MIEAEACLYFRGETLSMQCVHDLPASDRSSLPHDTLSTPPRTRAEDVERLVDILFDMYLGLTPDERAEYETSQV